MIGIDADAIDRVATRASMVEALRAGFREAFVTPVRHHHPMRRAGEDDAMLLLMPAWSDTSSTMTEDAVMGVKIVSVVPGNATRGVASVIGAYVLMSGVTGAPLAVLDGTRLTLWRTAAASALAADYLARPDARRLTMVGAGSLSEHLIEAHAAIRPIEVVTIWNRSLAKAEALAARFAGRPFRVRATSDLEAAVRDADVVSAATMSSEPLVRGAWLAPGTHVDLVGGYTPTMREADDATIARARVHVDTRAGALKEAGDLTQPLASGVLTEAAVAGELAELCRGAVAGRASAEEITLFKSVGTALEDLVAARLVYRAVAAA
ncbi:ornithine cyclodeaminase family protein [Pinisolibacter aquiterrae]|uniref:ornithine cyclodeaminase family protein n=1 Tax=Pinisolibacter aquiterrae TaxID=2815579 RepID=UPI001C3D32C3|nr:ornithine cyclodeaminase family protein [Pinisolibacter aquiterrae]MBV5262850.1 ornithine cyclodeaminase family protein [Pinisolibacter aquiterrae]MCC8236436.1 ornithine cyclodeaminase family protein [Pinisolibacter aquiterrae]